MSIAGENCLPAVGEIQPMTMRIATTAPARARIKMIANSSPPLQHSGGGRVLHRRTLHS